MRRILPLLFTFCCLCGLNASALAEACTSSSCQSFVPIENGKGVTIYRTYDLSSGSTAVRHMAFVVHGSGRNARHVFSNIVSAADSLGKLNETLVVAPFFKTADDAPGASDLYWTQGGWKRGDTSADTGVSSFEVIDVIAQRVIEGGLFAGLELVTVTGHSAGGQFTQRYAVGNRIQETYTDLKFNYVVQNPSSYMYLTPYRPVSGTTDQFTIPSGCSWYDEYKYGMADRNSYMRRLSESELVSQYIPRHVTYLVGSSDTSRTNNLDTTCAGDAQGYTRYERGLAFANYIEEYFPENNHQGDVAPGVGHDSYDMSNSSAGKAAIFVDPDTIPSTNGVAPLPPKRLSVK